MLAGRNGARATPLAASQGAQAPSEPSRAQLAPPSASTVTTGRRTCRPPGVANASPAPSNPCQRQRVCRVTPRASSRRSQARSSGEAFIATGNTRPEVPVNTSCSNPRAQV